MDWWIWLLIALGVALVIGLIIFLVIRTTKTPSEVQLNYGADREVQQGKQVSPSTLSQLQDSMIQNAYQRILQGEYNPKTTAGLGQGQRY